LHRGAWRTGDRIVRVQRIPCMPPLRVLRDAASTTSQERLVKDIAGLDRLRLATPQQVVADLDRWSRFPGKPLLRAAAEHCVGGLVHSEAEDIARSGLAAVGVHVHPRPLAIYRRGHLLGEVDLPVCSIRYGVEVDGPAHLEDGEPERDQRRDRRLGTLEWVIDRFSTDQVEDDLGGFVEAVLEGIAAAAARGVAPWPCDRCPC
jgi:hypothetical protein